MTAELAVVPSGATAERPTSGLALSFAELTMRVAQLDQFYREVMQEGTDYGKIPGTDKPTLYQPGAQMLDQIFGLVPTFEVTPSSVIDWNRPIPFFHYIVRCRLLSRRTADVVAEGIGSCNSHEDKYRWRNAKPACPDCGKELFRSKQNAEWFCWRSRGGCGTTVALNAAGPAGKVENEDTASLENTISKMAQKRAHIAATLNATGASRIFTQDVEDLPQFQQARTVIEARSEPRPAGAPDPEFKRGPVVDIPMGWEPPLEDGPGEARPTAATDVQGTARTPAAKPAAPSSSSTTTTTAGPTPRPKPEPTIQENARAREMVGKAAEPPADATRATLIAMLAQNIRAQRELGADIRMPTGAEMKALSDVDLRKMVVTTGDALNLAIEAGNNAE